MIHSHNRDCAGDSCVKMRIGDGGDSVEDGTKRAALRESYDKLQQHNMDMASIFAQLPPQSPSLRIFVFFIFLFWGFYFFGTILEKKNSGGWGLGWKINLRGLISLGRPVRIGERVGERV